VSLVSPPLVQYLAVSVEIARHKDVEIEYFAIQIPANVSAHNKTFVQEAARQTTTAPAANAAKPLLASKAQAPEGDVR